MPQLYDTIGTHYAEYRRPDPRIAAAIISALGEARRVVNIGAGTGSYEPKDRDLVAVEPSETMIRQRPPSAVPVVRASAMALPFRYAAFDTALAILTVHHWPDLTAGILEMARVAKRCVVLTWEPPPSRSWLTRDYFPEIFAYDLTAFPRVAPFYGPLFKTLDVRAVPIVRTGFSKPIGGARRPISTPTLGWRFRVLPASQEFMTDSPHCVETWMTGRGLAATRTC